MKCLYFDGELTYREDYPKPKPEKGQALIKIELASVCNTDKEILRGYKNFTGILGHEFVGVVEECEDENLIGKRVVGEINIGCNQCDFCQKGYPNHCRNRKILGMHDMDGAFADYTVLPITNLHLVPDNVSSMEAVFAEPLAAALQIAERVHIKPTDKVAIVGDGKLGQLIAQAISLTACDLTVIGKHSNKLELLKDKAKTILLDEANMENYFDIVIDCTGNDQGLIYSQNIVKAMGNIILKSTYNKEALLNPTGWVVNELSVIGTRCGPLDAALRLMERKLVSLDRLVSGVYSLKEYEDAFSPSNSLKAVFDLNS